MRISARSSSKRYSAKRARQLGLADAGGAEEDERADRTIRIREARTRAQHRLRDRVDGFVLPDNALVQLVLEMEQLLLLALEEFRDGNAGPARDHAGDVVLVDLFLRHPRAVALGEALLFGLELLLQLRQRAVAQLGDLVEIVLALGLLDLHLRLFDLLAQRAQLDRGVLLRVPARAQPRLILAQRRQLFLELLEPAAARVVVFLAQRLALDLELQDAARDLVELLRHRVDFGAQLGRGLVDQVDRLVGQEAIGDVAVAHRRGRDERASLMRTP